MAASFQAPKSKLVYEKSNFSLPKSRHNHIITDHYFNFSVEVIAPNYLQLEDSLDFIFSNDFYFLVHDFPLVKIIQLEFIEAFLKKGQLYLLSYGTKIDFDNTIAVLPSGHLILSLDNVTYQKLGLEGKLSSFSSKIKKKFVVTIDLTKKNFVPGKKYYNRVFWCFTNTFIEKFTCLVIWQPQDSKICPSSLPAYLNCKNFKKCTFKKFFETFKNRNMPIINCNQEVATVHNCGFKEFYDWIGTLTCRTDRKIDSFTNSYNCPQPMSKNQTTNVIRWTGFISTETIRKALEEIRRCLQFNSYDCWVCLTVHGFDDSPVSWKLREHGYLKNGDNFYSYIIFPKNNYWLYMILGAHDICP